MKPKAQRDRIDPVLTEWLLTRELSRRRLYEFVKTAWHVVSPNVAFQDNWHIGAICEHLEAVTKGQIRRLAVNVPPRTGKSVIASVYWFAWAWLNDPASRWIYASYDIELVQRDSVRCRDVVRSRWYRDAFVPEWTIKPDVDAKRLYVNTAGGSRLATTPGGRGTGFDADYIVGDDLHHVRDGNHPDRLKEVCDWWGQSMTTRGGDPANLRRCLIGQRVGERDISAYAREMGYECLVLPMKFEPLRMFDTAEAAKEAKARDPIIMTSVQREKPQTRDLRVKEDEILWPERFTPDVLEDWHRELGPQGVAGQLQQRPAPLEGTIFQAAMFRKFRTAYRDRQECVILLAPDGKERTVPLTECRFFQTADTAMTANTQSDYTVVLTAALTSHGDLLVWDVWRVKLEIPYQYTALKRAYAGPVMWDETTRTFTPRGKWPRPLLFQAVEPKASGIGLIQQAAADAHPFKVLKVDGDKIERSSTLSALYYAGKIWHKEGTTWLADFETELLLFPLGVYDDAVDCASYAAVLVSHDVILRAYLDGHFAYQSEESENEMAYEIGDPNREVRSSSGGIVPFIDEPD